MWIKQLCFLAAAGVVVAALVPGCGNSSNTGPTTSASSTTQSAGASAPAPLGIVPEVVQSGDKLNGITRVKTPDGGLLVTAPHVPRTLRDPRNLPDYSTGDWLVENLGSEPSIITPFLDKDAYGNDVQVPVIETLLTRDPETFEWQPWLAESYEQKPDGLTVVYTLRKDAMFSDGTPVTADDVVFSYQTMMDPNIDDARYKAGGDRIESCTRIDDRTVAFKFKEPFFQELDVSGGIDIIPKHVYQYKTADEFNKRTDVLIGSGPYAFDKTNWMRGQKIVLTRSENYWGPKPTFDRLVYVFIQNPSAAFQAFQNSDIDDFTPDPEQFQKFSTDPAFASKYTIYKFDRPNSGYQYIGWNEQKPMFADVKTRTALTMLVNRNTMIHTLLYDQAHPISGPFSYMTPQSDPSIKPLPFDPRKARQLLTEAGWQLNSDNILVRNGQKFQFDLMIPSDTPVYQKVCEFIKNQFSKAGIIVNITPFEFSVLVDRLDARNFDAAMLGWTGDIEEDPYQIWDSDSIKDKGSDFISWSNPEADKLIVEGRRELDHDKRMQIWHDLEKQIADDQPYTFLWIGSARVFIQPRFKNTAPYKTGLNTTDWYVPKADQKYH